jgi:hypothetical protein
MLTFACTRLRRWRSWLVLLLTPATLWLSTAVVLAGECLPVACGV